MALNTADRNSLKSNSEILLRTGVAFALLAALVPAARAERTRFWRQSSFEEFEKGDAKGVALRSDGKLVLAPRFVEFADPNLAYLWALAVDSQGRLYAAGGSNAKVLRFDGSGQATVLFESQEMAAQALAIAPNDDLYVATSPDGKVYRITPAGETSAFFDPQTKYIWDLALGSDGTLYVATGDKGEVFAVAPDGKGRVYYKSEETHARSLAFDREGRLLVGTEPNGLILRLEKPAAGKTEAGRAFVLYETDRKEVTSLLADRAGNVFAAAVGRKAGRTPALPSTLVAPVTVSPPQQQTPASQQPGLTLQANQQQPQPAQAGAFIPFPAISGGSEVYRIAPDGAPEVLWSSNTDLVYSLALGPDGKLLLGTGDQGVVVRIEHDDIYSNLADTASAQVTALAVAADGKTYVATANPGKIFVLGPDYEHEGSFESQVFDAKIFSHWGRLAWWGENGATNGAVEFYVRSGNTSNPEKNWSPWAGPYRNPEGQAIAAPPARFIQWKAVFRNLRQDSGARPGETPSIVWVSLAYLPKNVPPRIEAIALQEPGVRVQGFTPPQQAGSVQPVQLRLPSRSSGPRNATGVQQLAQAQQSTATQPSTRRLEPPPQGFAQKGFQSVLWSAEDDNDDDLIFSIYYRSEGEETWKLLKEKVEQKYFSWDTTTMPDGAYYLKIVASDSPSNPPSEALTAERISERFEIDNTPPEITELTAEPQSPGVRVRFTVRDSASAVARAEYSLDAGDWTQVFPADRVTDSRQENYAVVLKNLAPGEHTLAVRVYDRFENIAVSKVTFTVPGQRP
jgi:outer membrane protein assembly factor BamB